MKIALVQLKLFPGDLQKNSEHHLLFLKEATGADYIIFPELSLSGYEPLLVNDLATSQEDPRLMVFQQWADEKGVTIGAGLPTRNDVGVQISMIFFQPFQSRTTYSKHYLHEDELSHFTPGELSSFLLNKTVAPAICYETSVPAHATYAHERGATIYLASVVKDEAGIKKANNILPETARSFNMHVLMVNCVGNTGGYDCTGQSCVWNKQGELKGKLDKEQEGILLYNTDTEEVITSYI